MTTPVRANVVSVVILRPAGAGSEVLLMRRTGLNAGTWCQVAGKIESGEAAWQAALRELREETGLQPESFWSTDHMEQFYEVERDCVTIVPVFLAWVAAGAEPRLCAEHDAHQWLSFGEAFELVSFPGQRAMLRHIEENFMERTPPELLRIPVPT